MGAVPARILPRRTWPPPDVPRVRGSPAQRPRPSRHRAAAHANSGAIRETRQRGRQGSPPSDDAALPRRAAMITDKAALRAQMRVARDAFVASRRPAITVPDALRARFGHGVTLTSNDPIGSEADPSSLARAATEAGCVLALPHIATRCEPMRFLAWATEATLVAGPFSLRQPAADAIELRPDVILTPLVAFDAKLDRLGQAAAYYERAIVRFHAVLW